MNNLLPKIIQPGDEVRVIALSQSLKTVPKTCRRIAQERLEAMGLKVTFSRNVMVKNNRNSSSIDERIADLSEAVVDPNVKMILAATGGYNSNQLLPYIDVALWRNNPTAVCGYSDITSFSNGLLALTGIQSYSGPCFSTFGMRDGFEYTEQYARQLWMSTDPIVADASPRWSDDDWEQKQEDRLFRNNAGPIIIQSGIAEGRIIGGNLCSLNLLQGTPYMPSLDGALLFIEEDDLAGKYTPTEFERNLVSLLQLPDAQDIAAICIGRFQSRAGMNDDMLQRILLEATTSREIPIVSGLDFGHTTPLWSFPIGSHARVEATNNNVVITLRPAN